MSISVFLSTATSACWIHLICIHIFSACSFMCMCTPVCSRYTTLCGSQYKVRWHTQCVLETVHAHTSYPMTNRWYHNFFWFFFTLLNKKRISHSLPLLLDCCYFLTLLFSLVLYVSFHTSNLALKGDANTF